MVAELTARMVAFNSSWPALTQHLLKVHAFARTIGLLEGLDAHTQQILEVAALTHDIGIKPCMEQHGACTGKMQEAEGPLHAGPMLAAMGVNPDIIARVCYLIAHHHTYTDMDGLDYQILVEADFLVNLFEGEQDEKAREAAYRNIFRTDTGRRFYRDMFV